MPNVVQPSKTWVLKTKHYITTLLHMPNVVQISNKNKTLYHNHMTNVVQSSKTWVLKTIYIISQHYFTCQM